MLVLLRRQFDENRRQRWLGIRPDSSRAELEAILLQLYQDFHRAGAPFRHPRIDMVEELICKTLEPQDLDAQALIFADLKNKAVENVLRDEAAAAAVAEGSAVPTSTPRQPQAAAASVSPQGGRPPKPPAAAAGQRAIPKGKAPPPLGPGPPRWAGLTPEGVVLPTGHTHARTTREEERQELALAGIPPPVPFIKPKGATVSPSAAPAAPGFGSPSRYMPLADQSPSGGAAAAAAAGSPAPSRKSWAEQSEVPSDEDPVSEIHPDRRPQAQSSSYAAQHQRKQRYRAVVTHQVSVAAAQSTNHSQVFLSS